MAAYLSGKFSALGKIQGSIALQIFPIA